MQNGIPVGLRSNPSFGIARQNQLTAIIQSLFWDGSQGWWYDNQDPTTLFQDSAGTTPVTAVEQSVGLQLDKSKGLVGATKGGQLVGLTGSWFSTPSSVAISITGDIDIRVQVSLVSWTPAAITVFCSKLLTGASTSDSYEFWISTSGILQLLTTSGTTATNVASSVAVGFTAGSTNWVRVTWQQSTGFVNFYTSTDGITWVQQGAANRSGTTSATNAGTRDLRLGARLDGSFPLNGKIYRGQIYNGINGTLVSDFNPTLYSGGSTFTAATGEVWTITGSNARIVPDGNHRYQTTSGSRPVWSKRVNRLTKTEQFDDAAWNKINSTVTANAAIAPDGTQTADKFINNNGAGSAYVYASGTLAVGANTFSVCGKAAEQSQIHLERAGGVNARFNLLTGSVIGTSGGAVATITALGSNWYRCSITFTEAAATTADVYIGRTSGSGDGTSGIFIWGADLRPANQATGLLPLYQRVNTATDYDTNGFPGYLKADGTDDFLVTNSIDFTATDKVTLCAGVRKLRDTELGPVAELSATIASNNGTFLLAAPDGATNTYGWDSKGTTQVDAVASTFTAPITNVITGIGNISGDSAIIRVNGAVADTETGDQGTGNYGNYPVYFFRRGGISSTERFAGNEYANIAVGKLLTADQLTALETYMNGLTKAY